MVYEFPSLPLMVIFFGFCKDARTSTYYKRYKKCKKKKIQVRKSKSKSKSKSKGKKSTNNKTNKNKETTFQNAYHWNVMIAFVAPKLKWLATYLGYEHNTHILTVSSKPMIQASEPGNGLWSWWLPAPEGKVTVIADWRGTIIGLKSLKTKHNKDEIKIIINYYWQR